MNVDPECDIGDCNNDVETPIQGRLDPETSFAGCVCEPHHERIKSLFYEANWAEIGLAS